MKKQTTQEAKTMNTEATDLTNYFISALKGNTMPAQHTFTEKSGHIHYERKEIGKMMKVQNFTRVGGKLYVDYGNINTSTVVLESGAFKAIRHEYYNPTHFTTKHEALQHILELTK